MTSEAPDSTVVLIVEDERDLADIFAEWLSGQYVVRTAHTGAEAIDQMDDTVAVVLLDRRLPDMSGDDVLHRLRDNGYECQVAMVSAVDPDFDIVEMGFDDYVVKPVERTELQAVVKRLLSLEVTSDSTQEYFSMVAKREALRSEKEEAELHESEEYATLVKSIEAFETRIISLAEAYLAGPTSSYTDDDEGIYRVTIREWKERQRGLAEVDPLYQTAEKEIQRYNELLEQTVSDSEPKQDFLSVVAEGFMAEGFWLESRIQRALNEIFFDKPTDTLVINGITLGNGEGLTPKELFEASQTVRQKAEARLQSGE